MQESVLKSTLGRTPLDEWSARRRDLYLATHNTHKRQPPAGFEPAIPAGERRQTHALGRAATGMAQISKNCVNIFTFLVNLMVAYQAELTLVFDRICCESMRHFAFKDCGRPSHIFQDLFRNRYSRLPWCTLISRLCWFWWCGRGYINPIVVINPLKTKRRLLYLKTQSVPRSKRFSSRL